MNEALSIRLIEQALAPFRQRVLVLLLLLIGISGVAPVFAQSGSASREYQIKAAMLYHFAQFTEWPGDSFSENPDTFVVGVLGKDPFGIALDEVLHGKTVQGYPVVIQRFDRAEEARRCHILFISSSEHSHLADTIQALQGSSVLTVSEHNRFTNRGGIIRLFQAKNKTRFEINLEAAIQANLRVSSKLLNVAVIF